MAALTPRTVDELIARYRAAHGAATLPFEELQRLSSYFHPRFRFLKTLARGARLLDVGAGGGGLHYIRAWGEPSREDIELYGVDLERGELADRYAAWEIVDLDSAKPDFEGVTFDAALANHVIEHVKRPDELLGWLASRMRPGGRLYLEWPNATSLDLPPRNALEAAGWSVVISNFFDDATHRELKTLEEVAAIADAAGFEVLERGVVDFGLLTDQLIDAGRVRQDSYLTLQGFWSLTRWAAYLIAERRA